MDHYKLNKFIGNILKLAREQYKYDFNNASDYVNFEIYQSLPYDLAELIDNEVESRVDFIVREVRSIVKQELKEQLEQAADPNYNNKT